jgi:hypothetical protein
MLGRSQVVSSSAPGLTETVPFRHSGLLANHLVSRYRRQAWRWRASFYLVEHGTTHSAGLDADEYLARIRHRVGHVDCLQRLRLDGQIAQLAQQHCSHGLVLPFSSDPQQAQLTPGSRRACIKHPWL